MVYSTINPDFMKRWEEMAEIEGLIKEAYFPDIRIVSDSEKSGYSFGLMLNPRRFERYNQEFAVENKHNCHLCNARELFEKEPKRNLYSSSNYSVIMNKFPIIKGQCVAIHKSMGKNEKPMFLTSNLERLISDFEELLEISRNTGLQLFHNSPGFGATIPNHEHWHLTNFGLAHDITGALYGFDCAEQKGLRKDKNVRIMSSFPFAHAIFSETDLDKMISFFRKVNLEYGCRFEDHSIPHTISQGFNGMLVTFAKNYMGGGIGSGDVAGHIPLKTKEEFDSFIYNDCIKKLGERLFSKEEFNVENFL